jgi:hypothetical protein
MIAARGKMRLAEEYDAAQDRGEISTGRPKSLPYGNTSATVAGHGGARNFKVPEGNLEITAADIGLSKKDIHEARVIRDFERADPGITERALQGLLCVAAVSPEHR